MKNSYKVTDKNGKTIMGAMTARDAARLAKKTGGVRVKESPSSNARPGFYSCGAMGV